MNATLLQHATGRHEVLLNLSEPIHKRFCERHGIEYRARRDRRAPNNPQWDKINDIIEWCMTEPEGAIGIWLDADALWIDPGCNLAGVLMPSSDIGMVPMSLGILNTGAIWFRNTPRILQFWKAVAAGNTPQRATFPASHPFSRDAGEQAYVNYELMTHFGDLQVQELPRAFNDFKWAIGPRIRCVVKAWHTEPFPCRWRGMAAEVARLSKG